MYFLPDLSTSDDGVPTATGRRCLACAYNLRGLGDEPRCPECGLLNIPDGFRAQVWELVDSGVWFFSSMFHPLKKRPPGWWWALDRENDVKRSLRFILKNVCIATLVVMVCAMVAGGFVLERTHHYTCLDINNPEGRPVYETDWIESDPGPVSVARGWGGGEQPEWSKLYARDRTLRESVSSRVAFAPSWYSMFHGTLIVMWVCLVWACPGLVGLWTQIRRGLPKFALARRTIISAANYESHRLLYVGVAVVVGLAVETAIRLRGMGPFAAPGNAINYVTIVLALVVVVSGFGTAGWIGPLRSDFTKRNRSAVCNARGRNLGC